MLLNGYPETQSHVQSRHEISSDHKPKNNKHMKNLTLILCLFALSVHSQNGPKLKSIIDSLYSNGKCNEAIALVNEKIKILPENDTILYYSGWLKIHCTNDYQSALELFEGMTTKNPSSIYGNLGTGICLALLGEPEKAIDPLEYAESFKPKIFEVQYYLGYSYAELGKTNKKYYENAIVHFNKAIKINELSADSYFYRGISQFFGGNIVKASADFDNYDKFSKDQPRRTEFYLYGGISAYHLNNNTLADERLSKISESDSLFTEVLYFRGLSLLRANKPEEGFADLNKYIKIKPNNPNLYADIAEYYFNNEDIDLAYVFYNKAAKLGHRGSRETMQNFRDSKIDKRKLKQFNITFNISKNWLVDEFSEKTDDSNCKGAVIYDISDRIFIAILENKLLSTDPNAVCSMWNHEFSSNGKEDSYKTTQYVWKRQIANEMWTPQRGEPYQIEVWRILPIIDNNNFVIYIWSKPENFQKFDFYIEDFMESLRLRY